MLRAGSSRALVTPPLGTRLAGYPHRPAGSQSVHDDLFIRSLVLESEDVLYAVLSADLMGVESEWVAELRRRAQTELDIPSDHVLFATTHTHAAPGGLFAPHGALAAAFQASFAEGVGPFDEMIYELLLRQAISTLRQSRDGLRPASLRTAPGYAPGIASNRRDPATSVDQSCFVLCAVGENGDVIATVFHFACHPTILGYKDLGVSADFPGVASRILETSLGGIAMYVNGALGDVSTRFTRRSQTYLEVERLGRILAGAVLVALGRAAKLDSVVLRSTVTPVDLAPKDSYWFGDPEQRAAKLREELVRLQDVASHGEIRQIATALQGAESASKLAVKLQRVASVGIMLQRLQITPSIDFLAVPAEMFAASASALHANLPERTVCLVGPANGYVGYIPTAEDYEIGGYEIDSALVDRGSAELIIARALDILQNS